ncbi:chromate transporter [Clostridium sp. DJ247]|uniref:chromate transporter n=1 Tax=Clostridium sp. DJ247 TaxID=2726188 RepID=UPI00162804A5|nr:chromate transporter [Clostridium sp. DJ247]MBC2581485.1 chromate transporter [Clostridium sp. DJ247]
MLLCIKLFYVFFKIGLFSFGGGYVMLPMIYQDIQSFELMSAKEFSDVVALSQMTPGPIAVNAATYVGFRCAGILGATFATIGVSLPSFFIILIISAFINKFKTSSIVQSILLGIRPATVGMIGSAVIFFSKTSIFHEGFFSLKMIHNPLKFISIPAGIIFIITIVLTNKFKIGPIAVTVIAGVIGAFIL